MVDISRREVITTGAAAATLPFIGSDTPRLPPAPANQPDGELRYEHLPQTLGELSRLSDEQKIMLSALVASGCDAVAYYKPGANGEFEINKNIDLYKKPNHSTRFDDTLKPVAERADGLPAQIIARNGDRTYQIPVHADGHVKGIILLHGSNVQTVQEEPQYASAAKLKMARDIVNEHADLFGISGQILKQREQAHRDLPQKRQFFMTLVKDMFSTFLRNIPAGDPQRLDDVKNATNATELKRALRRRDGNSPVDQYSHVIGVTDLMGHAVRKAVNADGKHAVMNDAQIELIELLTLLHDVGKTQIPSQMFSANFRPRDQDETHFGYSVNGNHPLFTLITLLMYERDGLTTAAHHSGVKRYGTEEIADLKKRNRVAQDFDNFTELKGDDIPADQLPALSKLMRVADVTEAITGRADKPLHEAVRELGEIGQMGERFKMVRQNPDGSYKVTQDTVDPDYVCFMIANGAFKAYGEQRVEEANGWHARPVNNQPSPSKYDPAQLEAVSRTILARYHWDDPAVRAEKEAKIRDSIARDALIRENPGVQAQPNIGVGGR